MVTLTCINCNAKFDAERSTAKFCSDFCRVEYNRKKAKALVDGKEIKTASEVPAPKKITPIPLISMDFSEKEMPVATLAPWIGKIEVYCNENNITPDDLIEFHKNSRLSKKERKQEPKEVGEQKESKSNFRDHLKLNKCGIK